MKFRLGLDIGIASIGWAVIEHDAEDAPKKIVEMGVRTFVAAESPKDGSALAVPRREARGQRRRLRRKKHRKQRIRALIEQFSILTQEQLLCLYEKGNFESNPYELRAAGLDRLLSNEEWARVLIHISQRRGFKSNRKSERAETDKEKSQLLGAVSENSLLMKQKGYRTVGEMMHLDQKFNQGGDNRIRRNKGGSYAFTIARSEMLDEIRLLFQAQRSLGSPFATEECEHKYTEVFSSQRSFDEGPGEPSPYAGNQIENMIGACTFEPEEPRAPKAAYSFELFNALQKINSIRLLGIEERALSQDERTRLLRLCHETKDLHFSTIRKELHLSDDLHFNLVHYSGGNINEQEKKSKFNYLKAYHKMQSVIAQTNSADGGWICAQMRDDIAHILTQYKNDDTVKRLLLERGVPEPAAEALLSLTFTGYAHLSLKAIRGILPYLQQGLKYNEACEAAGYAFRGRESSKALLLPASPKDAPELADITNPVVRRAVSQTIKVINAIIRKHGSPQRINIELAREMAKPFDERNKLKKSQEENAARNDRIRERLMREFGLSTVRGEDILKLRLYEEQDGICLYSGRPFESAKSIFEAGVADIDHIIPYSLCFDDSFQNKALVRSDENRSKGNRLPLEYLRQAHPERVDSYTALVHTLVRNIKKRNRLLKERITEAELAEWKQRNLNDTKYIATFMHNFIRNHLEFAPSAVFGKKPVLAVNGSITAYLRKRWGITKAREDGDLHHAADAAVIACVSDRMIQQISGHVKRREAAFMRGMCIDRETGELLDREGFNALYGDKFPEPWPLFRKELYARLSENPGERIAMLRLPTYAANEELRPVFVSRMPRRKATGPAHAETIRSIKNAEEGCVVSKVPILSLKLHKDTGEIEGYFKPESDRLLYEALRSQLAAHGNDAKKAFAGGFYKPKSDGTPGPQVHAVKIQSKSTSNVPVLQGNGVANNGSMIRVDIFLKNGKYFGVPIYVADTVRTALPNRAVIAHKGMHEWEPMQEGDFLFSLYPNDLLYIEHKSGFKMTSSTKGQKTVQCAYVYYTGFDISTAAVSIEDHDRSYQQPGLGIKTLRRMEKWQVDLLGRIEKVHKEKRQGFGKQEGAPWHGET